MGKVDLKDLEKFIKEYYDYTTTISITEWEYFSHFEWLEDWILHREITREDYIKEAYKDLIYDLLFNQNAIKEQLESDMCNYSEDSGEMLYIRNFYNSWVHLFDFTIKELENDFEMFEIVKDKNNVLGIVLEINNFDNYKYGVLFEDVDEDNGLWWYENTGLLKTTDEEKKRFNKWYEEYKKEC